MPLAYEPGTASALPLQCLNGALGRLGAGAIDTTLISTLQMGNQDSEVTWWQGAEPGCHAQPV